MPSEVKLPVSIMPYSISLVEKKVLQLGICRKCGIWFNDVSMLLTLFAPRLCRCIFHSVESPYLMLRYLLPPGKNMKEAGWVERNLVYNPQSSLFFKNLWVINLRWHLNCPGISFISIILQVSLWLETPLSNEPKRKWIQILCCFLCKK